MKNWIEKYFNETWEGQTIIFESDNPIIQILKQWREKRFVVPNENPETLKYPLRSSVAHSFPLFLFNILILIKIFISLQKFKN